MSSDTKNKPVPFSADQSFIEFLDDLATATGGNRSSCLRQAAKEFTKLRYPQVFAKHFPDEVEQLQPQVMQVQHQPTIFTSPQPVSRVQPRIPTPTQRTTEDDFLSTVVAGTDMNKQVAPSEPVILFGVPDNCPNCEVSRYEFIHGQLVKTNVHCSTNPEKGKWICNECSTSGEYYPDKEPTIDK